MRRLAWGKTVLLGTLIVLGASLASVRADFVATETTRVTQINASMYFYSYTISVAANSTASASEVDFSLNAPIDPNTIVNPSNFFAFYNPGDAFTTPSISFTAFDNGTAFNGINPGSNGTFSFFSAYAPMAGFYQASGFDQTTGFVSISGTTLVPSIVPEPSSLLLLSFGSCGALGLFVRARRRTSVLAA